MIKPAPPVFPSTAHFTDGHDPAESIRSIEPTPMTEATAGVRPACATTNVRTVVPAKAGGHGHRNMIELSDCEVIEKFMKDMKEAENESAGAVLFRKMIGMKKAVFEVRVTLVSDATLLTFEYWAFTADTLHTARTRRHRRSTGSLLYRAEQ
jgi:hypothetical protein